MTIKKNILIISYTYPPSNAPAAQRPYGLAKYIDKNKYKVTVITCLNPDSSLGFDTNFDPELEDVQLIKIKTKVGSNTSSLRNSGMADNASGIKPKLKKMLFKFGSTLTVPDKGIFWIFNVINYLEYNKELINQTDVVFTTSPLFSNHLVGKFIQKSNSSVKWIADFRDFHFAENWSNKSGIKKIYHKKIEKKILKNADSITFISEAMQKVYEKYYPSLITKFNYVYNGFDKDDFTNLKIETVTNKKITFFYAGSFYKGVRSPFPLLSLLDFIINKGFITKEEIAIKIAGNFEQELLEEAKKYVSFDCINFLGRIPRSEVLLHLTQADFLWLIVGNKITHYTGVPIKFYEYLAARRPIVNFAPKQSEPTKIINEYNLGFNFDVLDKKLNQEKFTELIELYKDGTYKNPLPFKIINKFARDFQAQQFDKIIDG